MSTMVHGETIGKLGKIMLAKNVLTTPPLFQITMRKEKQQKVSLPRSRSMLRQPSAPTYADQLRAGVPKPGRKNRPHAASAVRDATDKDGRVSLLVSLIVCPCMMMAGILVTDINPI